MYVCKSKLIYVNIKFPTSLLRIMNFQVYCEKKMGKLQLANMKMTQTKTAAFALQIRKLTHTHTCICS